MPEWGDDDDYSDDAGGGNSSEGGNNAQDSSDDDEGYQRRRHKPIAFVRTAAVSQPPPEEDDAAPPSFARPSPDPPPPPPAPAAAVKGFSKMAQRYMAKNGFSGRLGKHETGIAAPLEAMVRKEGAGLGSVPEASSLASNRAFEQEAVVRRAELEHRKQRVQHEARAKLALQNAWRLHPSDDVEDEEEDDVEEGGVIGWIERAERAWREKESRAEREMQVSHALHALKTRQQQDAEVDLQRIDARLAQLRVLVSVVRQLTEAVGVVDGIHDALNGFFALPADVVEDFDLHAVPYLMLHALVEAEEMSDEHSAVCLQLASWIQCSSSSDSALLTHVLQRAVLPRLRSQCLSCALPDMPRVYSAWIQRFPQVFIISSGDDEDEDHFSFAWERIVSSSVVDLRGKLELLQAWLLLLLPKVGRLQDFVASRLGGALVEERDLALCSSLLQGVGGLLSLRDFALVCECILQREMREGGGAFYSAVSRGGGGGVRQAAQMYSEWKQHVPVDALRDECIDGRLRSVFDYALELLRVALSTSSTCTSSSVDVAAGVHQGIFNAIEPQPMSFQDAKNLAVVRASRARQVSGESSSSAVGSLKGAVESLALGLGVEFHPDLSGGGGALVTVDGGKQVYVFGSRTLCYFSNGVIFAASSATATAAAGRTWRPVSVNQLVDLSKDDAL